MRWIAIFVCMLMAGARAAAEERPILQLDTGGHMARISASRLRRTAGSSSRPRTIRPSACGIWRAARPCARLGVRARRATRARSTPWRCRRRANGWRREDTLAIKKRNIAVAIRLYEFASGKLVALLKGHGSVVLGLAFSPDGSRLISGSVDNTAIIWDTGLQTGVRVAEPKLLHRLEGHKDHIYAVGFSPDGSRAVTGSEDHDLRLWRVDDGKEIAHMTGHGDKVTSLAVAPDGTVASGDFSGEIRLWDARDGRFTRILAKKGALPGSLSFSPDGKLLLTGNFGPAAPWPLHVYDVASGKEIATYTGHDNTVFATAFSPDGRWAASGGFDNRRSTLGSACRKTLARTRWQAVADREPGAASLGGGVLSRWAAHRLGDHRCRSQRSTPCIDPAAGRRHAWRAGCP